MSKDFLKYFPALIKFDIISFLISNISTSLLSLDLLFLILFFFNLSIIFFLNITFLCFFVFFSFSIKIFKSFLNFYALKYKQIAFIKYNFSLMINKS
jgi:hypothetical protein